MSQIKKASALVFLFVFSFSFIAMPPAFAFSFKSPVQKLSRGVTHMVASPFQLPKEIIQRTSNAGNARPAYSAPAEGFFVGAFTGLYYGYRQLTSGVVDVLTFYAPMDRNWGPIAEPAAMFPEI